MKEFNVSLKNLAGKVRLEFPSDKVSSHEDIRRELQCVYLVVGEHLVSLLHESASPRQCQKLTHLRSRSQNQNALCRLLLFLNEKWNAVFRQDRTRVELSIESLWEEIEIVFV